MTDLNSGTKICQNCGREVNLASFIMHEAFCSKNMIKCDICNKSYDRNQKDAHFDEFHSKIKCECGQVVEKGFLETHKNEACKKRQVECFYCDLSMDFEKLKDHLEACGTRTEQCDKCKKYVLIRDRNKHIETNCNYPHDKKKEVPLIKPSVRHVEKQFRPTSSLTVFPCEFCGQKITGFSNLLDHQVSCEFNINDDEQENYFRDNTFVQNLGTDLESFNFDSEEETLNPVQKYNLKENTVPCEFCDELIDFDFYENHLKSCGMYRYTRPTELFDLTSETETSPPAYPGTTSSLFAPANLSTRSMNSSSTRNMPPPLKPSVNTNLGTSTSRVLPRAPLNNNTTPFQRNSTSRNLKK
ncbi:unnamed protein product [Brachionus calyciflorus]|uniref:TRAFD1/XAF1 zinc finger domain-containing protein n=1 Tax=Brachionus calyciflorus TaxID=104777 RepID=A0A813M2P1_9BILA|nr:unnamed protein product [Brachionus calyciflorus]